VVPPFLPRNSTSQPGCKSSSSMKRSFLDACASGSPDMLPLGYTTSPGLGSSLYSISIVLWTTMYVAVHWTNPSLCKVISALAPQVNVQLSPVKQHYMYASFRSTPRTIVKPPAANIRTFCVKSNQKSAAKSAKSIVFHKVDFRTTLQHVVCMLYAQHVYLTHVHVY